MLMECKVSRRPRWWLGASNAPGRVMRAVLLPAPLMLRGEDYLPRQANDALATGSCDEAIAFINEEIGNMAVAAVGVGNVPARFPRGIRTGGRRDDRHSDLMALSDSIDYENFKSAVGVKPVEPRESSLLIYHLAKVQPEGIPILLCRFEGFIPKTSNATSQPDKLVLVGQNTTFAFKGGTAWKSEME